MEKRNNIALCDNSDCDESDVSTAGETDSQDVVDHEWGSRGIVISLYPLTPSANPVVDRIYDLSIFITFSYDFVQNYQRQYKLTLDPGWARKELWDDEYLTTANDIVSLREIQSEKRIFGLRAD